MDTHPLECVKTLNSLKISEISTSISSIYQGFFKYAVVKCTKISEMHREFLNFMRNF